LTSEEWCITVVSGVGEVALEENLVLEKVHVVNAASLLGRPGHSAVIGKIGRRIDLALTIIS